MADGRCAVISPQKFLQLLIEATDFFEGLSSRYNPNCPLEYFKQCFEVERKLGKGCFGEVFKVRSLDDEQHYAVKKSLEPFKSKTDRRNKLKEVSNHEKIPPHENCVKLFSAWTESGHLYLQVELCRTTLRHFMLHCPDLSEQMAWAFFVDMFHGVGHLHAHNLVHMDIKPDNVLIDGHGRCKLADFARMLEVDGDADPEEGDAKYLAPELLQDRFSKAADIFSLGLTMLEISTDYMLPRGDGPGWNQLRSGNLTFLNVYFEKQNRSQALRDLVLCALLEPNPDRRPTAAQLGEMESVRHACMEREPDGEKWDNFKECLLDISATLTPQSTGFQTPDSVQRALAKFGMAEAAAAASSPWQPRPAATERLRHAEAGTPIRAASLGGQSPSSSSSWIPPPPPPPVFDALSPIDARHHQAGNNGQRALKFSDSDDEYAPVNTRKSNSPDRQRQTFRTFSPTSPESAAREAPQTSGETPAASRRPRQRGRGRGLRSLRFD